MQRILSFALFLLLCLAGRSECQPKYEMRGAWIATAYGIDWPTVSGTSADVVASQKAELDTMLTRLHRTGFNAVFFQVRPMADALYDSAIEPASAYVSGRRGVAAGFDPLAYCVAKAHRLGLECHAWVNPFRVGQRLPQTEADRRHSHLWMTNRVGRQTMTIFNPALSDTRRHIASVCADIATRYDIDGLVFDDYFYNPEFLPEDSRASDWADYIAQNPGITPDQWRRNNIDLTIAAVSDTLAAIKGGIIRFGVSPQGIAGGNGAHCDAGVKMPTDYGVLTADSQYGKIYSDPVNWLRQGLVDYVSPQIYWSTDHPRHSFVALAGWWAHVAGLFGRHCFPSQTIANLSQENTPQAWGECMARVMAARREAPSASGAVFYSATNINGPRNSGLGQALADSVFSRRALIPPMTWKHDGQTRPTVTDISLDRSSGLLSWHCDAPVRFAVYAVPADTDIYDAFAPEGGLDNLYLIDITYTPSYILPQALHDHIIAVAPYDRFGYEWDFYLLSDSL